jgi:Zn-dependent peptidase ImmA (M78 family)
MHYTMLEDLVKALYLRMGVASPEEIDMNDIADFFGIRIIHSQFGSRAFTRPFVGINLLNSLTPQQQWEDFGHELRHLLFDSGIQFLLPNSLVKYIECKANSFMYHFCVPTFMLEKLIFPAYNAALFIAEKFNVTLKLAEKRLYQFKCKLHQERMLIS